MPVAANDAPVAYLALPGDNTSFVMPHLLLKGGATYVATLQIVDMLDAESELIMSEHFTPDFTAPSVVGEVLATVAVPLWLRHAGIGNSGDDRSLMTYSSVGAGS